MPTLNKPRRLAGIRFEDRTPPAPTLLPRMDIAAFVGFAANGPLHTPVAVEDPARFAEIFGPDLRLARDSETATTRYAHLGPTVRAYFANGGRRCWIVRVADEGAAEQTLVFLPGVLRADPKGLSPAVAAARSPGAWADLLGVKGFLASRSVTLTELEETGSTGARLGFAPGAEGAVRPGTMIRLTAQRSGDEGWLGFAALFASEESDDGALRYQSRPVRWFRSAGESALDVGDALLAQSFRPESSGIPTTVVDWPARSLSGERVFLILDLHLSVEAAALRSQWILLRHPATGRSMWMLVREAWTVSGAATAAVRVKGEAWWSETPPAAMRADPSAWLADVVSLDLRVHSSADSVHQLLGLGLAPEDERTWARLPSDRELFAALPPPPGTRVPLLWLEAAEPRFPLCREDPLDAQVDFLPLGLDSLGLETRAFHSTASPLIREGLEHFGAQHFLEDTLARIRVDALAGEAEARRIPSDKPSGGEVSPVEEDVRPRFRLLRGIHAVWPLSEVSLIAVPDCVHRGWEAESPPAVEEPETNVPFPRPDESEFLDCARPNPWPEKPRLELVDRAGDAFTVRCTHASEPGAWLVVQEARRTNWTDATVLWILPVTDTAPIDRVVRSRPPGDYYYRALVVVRYARSDGCANESSVPDVTAWFEAAIVTPERRARQNSEPPESPKPPPPVPGVPDSYVEDQPVDNRGAPALPPLPDSPLGSPCAFTGFEHSDWSVGLPVSVAAALDWFELPSRRYDPTAWVTVSRALVRLCGARSDVMALLALPDHVREAESLSLEAELTATPSPRRPAPPVLTESMLGAGEANAWSFSALYHPWLSVVETPGRPLRVPPLGAIAGIYAGRALDHGAWIAPANQPLLGVVALAPYLDPSHRQDSFDRQINLLRDEPPGFLALSQDTLARDPDSGDSPLRPVNVRRLMILLRRLVLREGERFVFEPNGENLRVRVRHTFESVLARLQLRGAFAGRTAAESFQVECGDSLNPPRAVETGRFVVQIKVAPSRPLAFLTIRLVQTGERGRVVEIL